MASQTKKEVKMSDSSDNGNEGGNVTVLGVAKTPWEGIADEASSIVSQATAHTNQTLDGLQKQLDQLRTILHERTMKAEDAIRDCLAVNQSVAHASGVLADKIEAAKKLGNGR